MLFICSSTAYQSVWVRIQSCTNQDLSVKSRNLFFIGTPVVFVSSPTASVLAWGALPAAQHIIFVDESGYCRFVPANGLPTTSYGDRTPAGFEILGTAQLALGTLIWNSLPPRQTINAASSWCQSRLADHLATFSSNALSFGMMDVFLANPACHEPE